MLGSLGSIIAVFVVCFLLGSVPWGLIISKLFFHKDIRQEGSGNIGTTNAMRSLGKVGGAAVFVLDFGKGVLSGVIALMVAGWLVADPTSIEALFTMALGDKMAAVDAIASGAVERLCVGVAFLACTWGHIFSPWLGFKGGKGIAVAVGCLFVTFGVVGALLELAIFIVLVVATRYVSVGSIAAALACPFFSAYYFLLQSFSPVAFVCCAVAGLTVVWAHRANIQRLLSGTENRIGSKKKQEANS